MIAKPLGGTKLEQIETIKISEANLLNEKSILAAPIIYQQLIEGTKHLRINIFGSRFFTFILESQDLDWRSNYDLKYKLYDLPDSIAQKLTGLLHSLNLKMGIVDCKVDKDGNIYFLEVNPQGQFLFWNLSLVSPCPNTLQIFVSSSKHITTYTTQIALGGIMAYSIMDATCRN
ncbi:hypothetical protein THH46_04315 [Pseudomonas sp. NA13]